MSIKSNKLIYILIFFTAQAFCQQLDNKVFSEGLAPVKSTKSNPAQYGFVDKKGNLVIKPQFDSVLSGFNQGFAVVMKSSQVGVINSSGNTIVPFEFSHVSVLQNNLFPVRNHQGLWGFFHQNGKSALDCQYNNFRFRDHGVILVQKEGHWGSVDMSGKTLVKNIYRELEYLPQKRTYNAYVYNDWKLLDINNQRQGQFKYDSLKPVGNKVFKYMMLGKYGLVDMENKPITTYKYDYIGHEKYGKFEVKIWDKVGVIDASGHEVLPVDFEKVLIDSVGIRAAIKTKEGKLWWGLYDHSGAKLLTPNYPFLGELGDGLVPAVAENGIWRYINLEGKTVLPFKYAKAGPFVDGLAQVTDYQSEKQYFINNKGVQVVSYDEIPFFKASLFWLDRDHKKIWKISRNSYDDFKMLNQQVIQVSKQGKFGLLSTDDKLIVPCKYDFVSEPSENGYSAVRVGNKWGVIGRDGKYSMGLTDKYERILKFQEDFACVVIKGRYGFIDAFGNMYISPQYPDAGNVSEGMVSVKINNKWGFINTEEKLMVQPYYDQVWPYVNNCAMVYAKGKYNLVNKQGKELFEPLDKIRVTSKGRYLLEKGGKTGMADEFGKEILPIRYEMIREVSGGYFIVNLRGLYGVLDKNHNIMIPITHHHIEYDPFNDLFICGQDNGNQIIKLNKNGKAE
jgi:hypothetical protein